MANADGQGSTPKRLCRLEAPAAQMDADREMGKWVDGVTKFVLLDLFNLKLKTTLGEGLRVKG